MTVTIYALKWVPEFVRGQVRDLRIRWALEEAGIPYQSKTVTFEEKTRPDYLALQPFGQVPAYEDDEVQLFESAAIAMHVARKSDALLPSDPAGRARAEMWVVAALSSIEPWIFPYQDIVLFNADKEWAKLRKDDVEAEMMRRLNQLGDYLKDRDYLEDRFTVGDLIMIAALRALNDTGHVPNHPVLGPYVARGEARPAFQRAMASHLADLTGSPPPGF